MAGHGYVHVVDIGWRPCPVARSRGSMSERAPHQPAPPADELPDQPPDQVIDQLIRAVHRPSGIRIVAAVSTGLGRDAARRHGTSPAVACALSRGLSAGLLLATLTRGGERVTIQLICDGPLKGLTIDA